MNAANRRSTSVSISGSAARRRPITLAGSLLLLSACIGVVSACSSDNVTSGDSGSGGHPSGAAGARAVTAGAAPSGTAGAAAAAAGAAGAHNPAGGSSSAGAPASAGSPGTGGVGPSPSGGSGGSIATGGASTGSAGTSSQSVENQSADCTVGTLPEPSALTSIPKLPDPFMKLDGKRVATKAEWRCRRQEIRKQAEKYILGRKPTTPDIVTTGTVSKTLIAVHVEAQGKSIDFTAKVVLPSKGEAPFPAMISVGNSLNLGESRMLEQGVAVIYYDNYQLGKEGQAEASRGKPNPGKFYDIYGGNDEAGLLMAWAWGASRMLDVIQKSGSDIIDITGLGVSGCSRLGKAAFTIGVFDDRIALTIPQEPSTGGDPALRIMDKISGAERTDYNYNGLNWLSNNFAPFVFANNTSNAVKLPIDTHALVGMIAPRGILILENPHQTQMGAPAGHTAAIAGLEVFKALGVEKNISYHSNVKDTAHCSYKTEYTDLINKNIAAFLKHTGEAPGQFLVGSGGSLTRADWIDWTAPALQ